jgi:hypothetical protein
MISSFDTQLQVSLRALREVVAPALQHSEKHVIEQLHLAIATLDFAKQRLPYARRYYRLELENYISFAAEVRGLIGTDQPALRDQLAAAEHTGNAELLRPEAEVEDYLIVSRRLRELIAAAVPAAINKPYEHTLDLLILKRQEKLLLQQRAWCVPLGFDPKPEQLPSMDQLLDSPVSAASKS